MRQRRLVLPVLLLSLGAARAEAQYYELFAPKSTPYHVGDTLVFLTKLTGVEQMSPVDPAPKLAQPLPEGVLLLRADSLRRIKNGHYEGNVVFQYFRPGVQYLPQLVIRVRNLGADPGRVIAAVADPIEVVPTIPDAGEPRPEDIRPPVPVGPPAWPVVLGSLIAMLALVWLSLRWRARRARQLHARVLAPALVSPLDARRAALARLDALRTAGLARQGDVARHYGETVDVLRDFLHAMRRVPRARAATAEMLTALAEAAGIPASAAPLLVTADFVKFAAVRPDVASAERFLDAASAMVEQWEPRHAIR